MRYSRYVSVPVPNPDDVVRVVADPREYWAGEVTGFTPWLAGHLPGLSRCLGVELKVVTGREQGIGEMLRADLVARDVRGRLVLIEVQMGHSDHAHLGKLVTYQALTGAEVLVWVVAATDADGPPIRYEHRLALAALRSMWAATGVEVHAVEVTVEATYTRTSGLNSSTATPAPRLRRVDLDHPELVAPDAR